MVDRLMTVNAYTTLDLVDAVAEGHGFEEEAFATLNVTSPRQDPDHVSLQLELDNTQLSELPAHAETLTLTPDQARAIAADLEKHADKVEAATGDAED
jgi:precorrin-2 methylase